MSVRRLAAATTALFVASVAGLLTVDDGGSTSVVTTAVAATKATGTASFSLEQRITFIETPNVVAVTGKVDFARGRASATLTPPPPQPSIEVVIDGTTTYVRATGPYQAAAQGKAWVVVPAFSGGGALTASFTGAGDPLLSLEALRKKGALRSVAEEGVDEVRGVRVTRYRAELDPAAAIGAMRGLQVVQARATVWVSDDGLVRRQRMTTTIGVPGAAVTGTNRPTQWTAEMTLELFDFGTPVQIEVPPADQVQRLAGLPR